MLIEFLVYLEQKPKRKVPVSHVGRSTVPEKSQRSRSVSFSPDRVRLRGRSPAFNALAANFEKPNTRNLSTPPPMVRKLYPKSAAPDSSRLASKSAAIAALTASFEKSVPPPREARIPRSVKGMWRFQIFMLEFRKAVEDKLAQLIRSLPASSWP